MRLPILRRLAEGSGTLSQIINPRHLPSSGALTALFNEGLVEGRGPDWNTCLFVITDAGRQWLREHDTPSEPA